MEWLNYHHLFYFWVIVQERGLARAAHRLHLTHSTMSTQLRSLEEFLGGALFERRGRRLVLTPFGADVAEYASEIFRLGGELVDVARGRTEGRRSVLRVGVVGSLPKTLVHRLLEPALAALGGGTLHVRQDTSRRLVNGLGTGRLDIVLSDEIPDASTVRIHAHVLGETEILLYGARKLALRLRRGFPGSLQGAPFVLPSVGTNLRRRLDRWLVDRELNVQVEAEVDDAGMLRVLGGGGLGLFPVRAALRAEVEDVNDVVLAGRCAGLRERYYALTTERRVKHPAVAALIESARERLHAASRAGA